MIPLPEEYEKEAIITLNCEVCGTPCTFDECEEMRKPSHVRWVVWCPVCDCGRVHN